MNISVFLFTVRKITNVYGGIIVFAPNEDIAFEILKSVIILNDDVKKTDFDISEILTLCSFNGSTEDWQKEKYNKVIITYSNISIDNIIFFVRNIFDIQSKFIYKIYEYYDDKENTRKIYLYGRNNIPYISVMENISPKTTNILFSLSEIMNDYSKLKKENEILKNKLEIK